MSFSHFDEHGASQMVDVSRKEETLRTSTASGLVRLNHQVWERIQAAEPLAKGNVLEVARLAGILAAKHTATLIPLCHPLPLHAVKIEFTFPRPEYIRIQAEATLTGRTGVEMEALAAVSISALTIYDMCKSLDKSIVIEQIQLEKKTGGKSGTWSR
ncbi:MAG TPA: cyclic pyranopterin monophosphate synthase MoaC [Gemmatales bacterium]|nr:cyclic pyranopterin monophosphate synthase MoaC [Gemmatales bacterium]